MAIDYGLDVRQAAINNFLNASARRASAKAEADARERRAARQKRKGLMSLALHAGAAVATGGASIPYSMKYGAMANQALLGDDYQGSDMQALQGLGSMVYQGAEANKMKNLASMEKAYNGQLDSIYKAIDALPPGAKMERARLANQAANLTTTFQKNLKAAEAKPVWEFASSERERMQAKSLGEVADKGQKAYDEMYTQQSIIPQKVKEAEGSQVSDAKIAEAYQQRGTEKSTTPAPVATTKAVYVPWAARLCLMHEGARLACCTRRASLKECRVLEACLREMCPWIMHAHAPRCGRGGNASTPRLGRWPHPPRPPLPFSQPALIRMHARSTHCRCRRHLR